MKRIYDFSRKPAHRNYTVSDLKALKHSKSSTPKLTMSNPANKKDIIAICDVGAYGMSLSSNYNLRPKPIELLIEGSKIKVIRKRQKYTDFI